MLPAIVGSLCVVETMVTVTESNRDAVIMSEHNQIDL